MVARSTSAIESADCLGGFHRGLSERSASSFAENGAASEALQTTASRAESEASPPARKMRRVACKTATIRARTHR